jgi:hypothetical protein
MLGMASGPDDNGAAEPGKTVAMTENRTLGARASIADAWPSKNLIAAAGMFCY